MGCIFCEIVEKQKEASVIHEDKKVICFMDSNPVNLGHVLVVPKKHYAYIYDMPPDEVGYLFQTAQKVAVVVHDITNADGISISQNNGKAALQSIFHVHVHIIPRYEKDKHAKLFLHLLKAELESPSRKELDKFALLLRKKLIQKNKLL